MDARQCEGREGDTEVDPDLLFQCFIVVGLSAGELTGIMEYSIHYPSA